MTTNAKKLKLLVTGASGFIGYEVSRQLSRNGYRPRLMIRQPGDDCEICRFDADITLADLRHPDCLRQAVKGVDGIIHLGARATFESYNILKPSILDGSIALMEAGIEAGVRRFVYSSSLLVYSDQASLVTADTQVNPVLDYGRIKVDTEKRLSAMAASAGVAFTALRLPHVYGVRDLYFRQLQPVVSFCRGLAKTSIRTFTSPMRPRPLSPVRSNPIPASCPSAIACHPHGPNSWTSSGSTTRMPACSCFPNGWPFWPRPC